MYESYACVGYGEFSLLNLLQLTTRDYFEI